MSGGLSLHLIDAFAEAQFTGNPAAVVFLDHERPDAWMQQLAMEMNQAETAFLLPRPDGFALRWMTPVAEVDLCGHATLASAHYLWSEGVLGPDEAARFHTRSGLLTARRTDGGWIGMDFPAIRSRAVPPPDDVTRALGVTPGEVLQGDFDLLCVVDSAATVRALTPDLAAVAKWDVRGVIVTAPVCFSARSPRRAPGNGPASISSHAVSFRHSVCRKIPSPARRIARWRCTGPRGSAGMRWWDSRRHAAGGWCAASCRATGWS